MSENRVRKAKEIGITTDYATDYSFSNGEPAHKDFALGYLSLAWNFKYIPAVILLTFSKKTTFEFLFERQKDFIPFPC